MRNRVKENFAAVAQLILRRRSAAPLPDCQPPFLPGGLGGLAGISSVLHGLVMQDVNTYIFRCTAFVFELWGVGDAARTNSRWFQVCFSLGSQVNKIKKPTSR